LIISDPPWIDAVPANDAERAFFDPGRLLIRSLLKGLKLRLTENGKAWLYIGTKDCWTFTREKIIAEGLRFRIVSEIDGEHYRHSLRIVEVER